MTAEGGDATVQGGDNVDPAMPPVEEAQDAVVESEAKGDDDEPSHGDASSGQELMVGSSQSTHPLEPKERNRKKLVYKFCKGQVAKQPKLSVTPQVASE